MAKKSLPITLETALLIGGATILVGIWLGSKPNCPTCTAVGEHLIEHGIRELFTGVV